MDARLERPAARLSPVLVVAGGLVLLAALYLNQSEDVALLGRYSARYALVLILATAIVFFYALAVLWKRDPLAGAVRYLPPLSSSSLDFLVLSAGIALGVLLQYGANRYSQIGAPLVVGGLALCFAGGVVALYSSPRVMM